jgi:hypothetical protein
MRRLALWTIASSRERARARADELGRNGSPGLRPPPATRISAFSATCAENLNALPAELAEDAQAAAAAVDAAAHGLVAAYHERMLVENRVTTLSSLIRIPRVGDVARTKAEPLVREAERLLANGGEQAPTLAVDPRAPRHGAKMVA